MKELIGLVIIVGFIVLIATSVFKYLNKEIEEVESRIGTSVVYEKDTLMIIDYSIFNETYTLSNGLKVNFKLVEELKTIKY